MKRPALLDVNALIALFDEGHLHHRAAHAWFNDAQIRGWRTCSVTENGYLRILSHPSYGDRAVSVPALAQKMQISKREGRHAFWTAPFSTAQWIDETGLRIPSSKLTDAFLLKLAEANGGTLATFDRRIEIDLIGSVDPDILEQIPFP